MPDVDRFRQIFGHHAWVRFSDFHGAMRTSGFSHRFNAEAACERYQHPHAVVHRLGGVLGASYWVVSGGLWSAMRGSAFRVFMA